MQNVRSASREMADCLVAASSGTARLTQQVGYPIVLIAIVADAIEAAAELRRRKHGSATLWPGSFQPLEFQAGWDDWAIFPVENILGRTPSCCAQIVDGIIRIPLPNAVTLSELSEQFAAALRHLRFQDVVRQPSWLENAVDVEPSADIVIFPRYTLADQNSFRNAKLCTDLFMLDPTEQTPLLLWSLAAALTAASHRG